jgi:hypothetical protein
MSKLNWLWAADWFLEGFTEACRKQLRNLGITDSDFSNRASFLRGKERKNDINAKNPKRKGHYIHNVMEQNFLTLKLDDLDFSSVASALACHYFDSDDGEILGTFRDQRNEYVGHARTTFLSDEAVEQMIQKFEAQLQQLTLGDVSTLNVRKSFAQKHSLISRETEILKKELEEVKRYLDEEKKKMYDFTGSTFHDDSLGVNNGVQFLMIDYDDVPEGLAALVKTTVTPVESTTKVAFHGATFKDNSTAVSNGLRVTAKRTK